jgi:flavorubredoxin
MNTEIKTYGGYNMSGNWISAHRELNPDTSHPVLLYNHENHQIYWLGIPEHTAFRSNTYLLKSGDQALLFDPGHRAYFGRVLERVKQIIDPNQILGIVLCHQDPDVAASIVDWLQFNPGLPILTTPRTHILLPYYGNGDYNWHDISADPSVTFSNGHKVKFIQAPFLHFAGAFASYDEKSGFLFSGDVWAAIQLEWRLVVENFEAHLEDLDIFHKEYMASNIACRGFVDKLRPLQINAILPQHGSIIDSPDMAAALTYLETLQCGTDIIYPHLNI